MQNSYIGFTSDWPTSYNLNEYKCFCYNITTILLVYTLYCYPGCSGRHFTMMVGGNMVAQKYLTNME